MSYQNEYQKWLNSSALSTEEKEELLAIKDNPKEIESRFYGPLEFGTAGLRGTMAVGLHHMNIHVIKHATQAFAEVILAEGEEASKKGVAIGFDCRKQSDIFARTAACVMVGNGIPVRIFDALRPTPEVSYAIREYGCIAGINVTASHNPREYNGYKVYWSDGAQLPPHHAEAIAQKMAEIDLFDSIKMADFDKAVTNGMIVVMSKETDEKFLENVMAMSNDKEVVQKVANNFKMVFTPFHGCGYRLIPEALQRLGLKHVICESKQMIIDGDFPTVKSPNPENPDGFYLAVDLANKENVDFIIGSDPDADRIGLMIRDNDGKFIPLSGNQTGAMFLDYYINALKRNQKMPQNPVALKSIVSTDLVRKIAETNGVKLYDTFTGFKFMAEKKNELEAKTTEKVIWSFEESYGYMVGDYVRDKDAVTAALLLTEMACYYANQGLTVYQGLQKLYEKYGNYAEHTLNLVMPGLDGLEKMANLMKELRENPPKEIQGTDIITYKDYKDGSVRQADGSESTMALSGSNVLEFNLADSSKILVRPSGTEPKVKVYLLISGGSMEECNEKVSMYTAWAEGLRH